MLIVAAAICFNAPKGGNAVLTESNCVNGAWRNDSFNAPKGGNAVLTNKDKESRRISDLLEVSMPRRAVMLF